MLNAASRTLFAAIAAVAFLPGMAAAQAVQRNPIQVPPSHFDISPPIREMVPGERPGRPAFLNPPRPLPRPQHSLVVDPVVQSTPSTAVMPATSNNFPGLGNGFSGFTVTGAPSDDNLAVGPNDVVQGVNTSYAVFSKSGTLILGPTSFSTVFTGFSDCTRTYYSDPIVLYDRQADRWVLSILAFNSTSSGPFYHCIAVSTSNDPTGSYARYSFVSQTNLPDYPKMGVWPDAYYVTYNMFSGNTLLGAQVCAHNRSAMLAGQSETAQCFTTSSSNYGLLPADVDGPTVPPTGSPNYLLSLASVANTLSLWNFRVDWTTPANSTLTGPTNLAVAAFNEACTNGGTCIPQSGTSTQLDSLGDRLMYRLAYRNFGDHESLVANHSVNAGSETGVRWYEIRSPGSNPVVYQQGTYAPDANHRWMASLAIDSAGDIGVGFSVSGSAIHPEIHYAGRLSGDPLGTLPQGEASIIDGAGSQTTYTCFIFQCALTRWGDYTAIQVDPSDDCTFLYTNQYIPSNGAFNWSTRIASFKFPSCGGTVTAPAAPTNLSATGGNAQVSLTWTGSSGATSYNVYSSTTSGGTYANIGSSTSTSYSDTKVTNGTPYYYVVSAVNSAGESGKSNEASATPQAPPPAPSFTLSAPAFSVRHGSSAQDTITITPANGFTGNVQLSASNLPPRSTASFSPNPVTVSSTGSSTMTLTTSSSTKRKTYTITITGTGGGITPSTTVNVTVN